MPIAKDAFGKLAPAGTGRATTVAKEIENFLKQSPNLAYSTSEIVDALDLKRQTANQTLAKMAKEGKLQRGSDEGGNYYHMIAPEYLAKINLGEVEEEDEDEDEDA